MSPLVRIVIAQFCCTSVWFAGNAAMGEMVIGFNLPNSIIGHFTSAIQLGFILGTLCFAVLALADRFSPSRVFMVSAFVAALSNGLMTWTGHGLYSLLSCRLITGFALAGIYPVGMKIAADYFNKGLGRSLGYLVGALVLGTAAPHLLRTFFMGFGWQAIIWGTSGLALLGGLLVGLTVKDGPYRQPGQSVSLTGFLKVFSHQPLKKAAFGYFGHMWELYTFWAFVPILLASYKSIHEEADYAVDLWSFLIIAVGSLGCVLGGYRSESKGVGRTATTALLSSASCCLLCPLVAWYAPPVVWLAFLLFWGLVVIADSPLFSTLVAQAAPAEQKATALTIVNCVGFALTIISIQVFSIGYRTFGVFNAAPLLAVGPIIGWWFCRDQDTSVLEQ